MTEIVAVNLKKRVALTDDDQECPITKMLDGDGDETDDPDDPDDCVVGIVKVRDDKWMVFKYSDYDKQELQ